MTYAMPCALSVYFFHKTQKVLNKKAKLYEQKIARESVVSCVSSIISMRSEQSEDALPDAPPSTPRVTRGTNIEMDLDVYGPYCIRIVDDKPTKAKKASTRSRIESLV